MALLYPGIPGDYQQWGELLKRDWLDNYERAAAWRTRIDRRIATDTLDGIYANELAITGDADQAQKTKMQVLAELKVRQLMESGK